MVHWDIRRSLPRGLHPARPMPAHPNLRAPRLHAVRPDHTHRTLFSHPIPVPSLSAEMPHRHIVHVDRWTRVAKNCLVSRPEHEMDTRRVSITRGHPCRRVGPERWSLRSPRSASRTNAEKPRQNRDSLEFRNAEDHENYRRKDYSTEYFAESRLAFVDELQLGEAKLDLAKLALLVAAEDDAIASHSSVRFPVDAYLKRLDTLARDFEVILELNDMTNANDTAKVDLLIEFLFGTSIPNTARFSSSRSPFDRGDLRNTVVDAPGVYESPQPAYLNNVLTRKRGLSANLAIIASDVLRKLAKRGTLSHWVKVIPNAGSSDGIPLVDLMIPGQGPNIDMNACSLDALRIINIHLKRAFWPFSWQSNDPVSGGFIGASKTFLDGASSAESEAIARAALHRLQRGVWTSPGAGDIRRALAACERLVLLTDGPGTSKKNQATARRDYAILLLHVGRFEEAKRELLRYKELVDIEGNLSNAVYVDKLIYRLREVDIKSDTVFNADTARRQALHNSRAADSQVLPLTW